MQEKSYMVDRFNFALCQALLISLAGISLRRLNPEEAL